MRFGTYQRALLMIAAAPITMLTVLAIKTANTSVIERVSGGCYQGDLPGFGHVQFDLFADGKYPDAWLFREETGLSDSYWINVEQQSSGRFNAEIRPGHETDAELTNGVMDFRLENAGKILRGMITLPSRKRPEDFTLVRVFEHGTVHQRSGLILSRFGAYANFVGQVPLLRTNSPFYKRLSETLTEEISAEAASYTTGDYKAKWYNLRYGKPFCEARVRTEWQPRLLTSSAASFAVWTYPDYGGCGDPENWLGKNYYWQDGELHEFQLVDLFRKGSAWKAEIRRLCSDELKRQNLPESAAEVTNRDVDIRVFTASRQGLQIYFNPYEIGCGADGAFVIHIPYSELLSLFDTNGPAGHLPLRATILARNNLREFVDATISPASGRR